MTQSSNIKTFFATALIFAIVNASNGFKRIVGGTPTYIELFPYTVGIQTLIKENLFNNICGGSLILPDWVISAAHCFESNQTYYVAAGASNLFLNPAERRRITHIYDLGDYKGFGSMGDIVLIRLNFPLPINRQIQTIQLPPPSTGSIPLGIAVASGWGYSGYQDGQLRYAYLPILSCNKTGDVNIKEDMFCAGYDQTMPGICKGDSGGPLVLNGVLYGVASLASTFCETKSALAVYVKVPYYVQQIRNIIANTP